MNHDDDTCPHLVRANLLEAENARLKAEVKGLNKELADAQESYHLVNEKTAIFIKENARLKAEVDRLTPLLGDIVSFDEYHKLLQQVERLTKAGDELHAFLINYIVESRISSAYLNKLDDGWLAAKEGKPHA